MEKFEIFRDEKRIKTRINNDAIQCALKKYPIHFSKSERDRVSKRFL